MDPVAELPVPGLPEVELLDPRLAPIPHTRVKRPRGWAGGAAEVEEDGCACMKVSRRLPSELVAEHADAGADVEPAATAAEASTESGSGLSAEAVRRAGIGMGFAPVPLATGSTLSVDAVCLCLLSTTNPLS